MGWGQQHRKVSTGTCHASTGAPVVVTGCRFKESVDYDYLT